MRDAVKNKNKNPEKINPLSTVDLVIDHSVMVDEYASGKSFNQNVEREFSRNGERYSFLKWGQKHLIILELFLLERNLSPGKFRIFI